MTNEPVVNNMENKDKFVIIGNDDIASEKIIAPRYSYWRSVGRVFFRKKLNIFLIVAFILILLASFVVPVFCPYDPMENVTNAATFNMSPVKAMAYFGKSAPPLKWILGTGPQGNSIFYGLFSSAKTSLLLAMACAAINMSVGIDEEGHTFPAGTMYGVMVQYYLEKLGSPIVVADQCDGWFHPEEAKAALAKAKEELGDTVNWPIVVTVVYYGASDAQIAQANAVKTQMEATLGAENVELRLIEATTTEDYYASGYRAPTGEKGNYDLFYGSGWGPDYGDPSTYLDTLLTDGGYMLKVIGIGS